MQKLYIGALLGLIVVLMSGCQEVFTYSPLENLARDPANLSTEQQVTYAETVLSSGTSEEIEAAFEVITAQLEDNPDDPELNLLAADLAIAGSGLDDAINTALATPALLSGELSAEEADEVLTDILESLDIEKIEAAGEFIVTASADESAEISDSQTVIAGASLVLAAASEAGGFDELGDLTEGEPGYETLQEAEEIVGDTDMESLLGGLLGEDFTLPDFLSGS